MGLNLLDQPFLFPFYLIALINLIQGLFLLYKFFKGYGAYFPLEQLLKGFVPGRRYVATIPSLLVSPDKTTKKQRGILLIYVALLFLSIIIVLQIASSI